MTMLDHALDHARRGFYVFPVRESGKLPAIEKFPERATRDPETIKAWWTERPRWNVGIYTGRFGDGSESLVAIDVDEKGKNGGETLLKLELQGHDVPPTYTQRTPTGGDHIVYRVKGKPRRQGVDVLGRGLDVRANGGYIVAAGSIINDRAYTANDNEVAEAPTWVLDKCPPADEPKKAEGASAVTVEDSVELFNRAVRYLQTAPLSVEGEGGDDNAIKVAMKVKDFTSSQATALALLVEWWNPKCSPPWSIDDLREKVARAFKYGREEPGAAAPAKDFTTVGDGPVPFGDLLRSQPEPVAEIIQGLIEKGIPNAIDGPGGVHKSRLALQMALCVSAGVPVFGGQVEKCTSVFLSSEDGRPEITRRTHAIANKLGLPANPAAIFWDRTNEASAIARADRKNGITLTDFHMKLMDYLKSIAGHKFVVMDSAFDYIAYGDETKIHEDTVNEIYKVVLSGICRECDCTLLIVRHPSQAGEDRGDQRGWSVANHNSIRSRLSLVKDGARDAYKLTVQKRNHAAAGAEWMLYFSGGALLPQTDLEAAEQAVMLSQAVVRVAIECAEKGAPLAIRVNPSIRQMKRVEELAGQTVKAKQVKEELAHAAIPGGPLVYIAPDGKHRAGYYPAENGKLMARQLKKPVQ